MILVHHNLGSKIYTYLQVRRHNLVIGSTILPKDTETQATCQVNTNNIMKREMLTELGTGVHDDIKPVSDDIVRLVFQNVNGLTQSSMVHAEIQNSRTLYWDV